VPVPLDAILLRGWATAATRALEHYCDEIDRINVFPVPDGDTGTNMLLTMRAAADAGRRGLREDGASPEGPGPVAAALARGALQGARGNSGLMLSQVLRGLAEAIEEAVGGVGDAGGTVPTVFVDGPGEAAAGARTVVAPPTDGAVLAEGLHRADRLATAAFSHPREGTGLSVLRAAAAAASARVTQGEGCLAAVAASAGVAAAAALRETTAQLPELARAGVVDAGGFGLCVVLEALACVADRRPLGGAPVPAAPLRLPVRSRAALTAEREAGSPDFDYEVMYLLEATHGAAVDELRERLDAIGDSVAVVGDGAGLWNVHVHCNDVGAALEAGLDAGRPHRVTVVRFADQQPHAAVDARFPRARAVLLVAAGEPAALAREAGADVLERTDRPIDVAEIGAALAGTRARHVVLLPGDSELTPIAERAATDARRDGQDVLVVPTSSVLQGLAALAVHDPERRPVEDVVAMAEAAACCRTAGLVIAESEALTWVGRCEPGDVLGISDGEVVLIAPDLPVGALWLAHRMLVGGGEIVTALLGRGVPDEVGEGLVADLRRTHPEVDTVVLRGNRTDYPLVLGVE
jgi:DAK2 domain fusion protein YloV